VHCEHSFRVKGYGRVWGTDVSARLIFSGGADLRWEANALDAITRSDGVWLTFLATNAHPPRRAVSPPPFPIHTTAAVCLPRDPLCVVVNNISDCMRRRIRRPLYSRS